MTNSIPATKGSFVGKIISDKMDKTRIVEVKSRKRHPKYKKIYTVTRKFFVHDEDNAYHTGDVVNFLPSKPYSKNKKFIITGKG